MVSALHRNFTARHFKNTLNLNSLKIRDFLKLAPLRHYVCFIYFYIALSCFVSIFHFHFRQLPLVFVEDDELAFCRPRHFWQLCRSGGWGGALQAQNSLSITHCGEKNLRNKPFFVVPRKCRLSFLWGLAHVAKSREKLRPLKPILTILLQILSTSCSSKTTAHSQGRGPTKQKNLGSCCIEVTLGVQLIKERLLQMRDHRSSAAKRILFCGSRGKQMRQGSFFW